MKKITQLFSIAAVFATMVCACEKEQATTNETPLTPEDPSPETVTYDPVKYLTGFGADMEATKADLDDASGSLSWTDGDQVKIIRSDGETALYTYNKSENKFVPAADPLEKNGSPMHAFFPADNFVWDTGHVQFTMPAAFESLTGIMNPMAAVIPADATAETDITLKNLGGIYEVRLTAAHDPGETVTKVQLGNSSVDITGSAPVSFDDEGTPSIGALVGGNKFATLEFASPVKLTSTSKSVYFFLPATKENAALEGMYIKAIFGKNGTYEPFEQKTRKIDSPMTITRSKRWHMNFSVKGFFSGGDGLTEATAYQIATADDFKAISTLMTSGSFFASSDVFYKQTADIDFNKEEISSIGVYNATLADATPFQGTYDGDNKKLEKFTVSGNVDASVGLFTYVNNATLKNIKVVNASVTGTNVTGILTGRCIGTTLIEGCSLDGGQVTGRNSVGFIAHIHGNAKVKGCNVNNITVVTAASGSTANNQGGVVGYAGGNASIESCTTSGAIQFTGTVSGTARGGIVGKLDSTGSVKGCSNGASIDNSLVSNTGGIAGSLVNGSITECVNTGNVSGKAYTGGIVGDAGSTSAICFIESCRTNAEVSGDSGNCVGGIVGRALNGVVISGCYSKGSVSGRYDVGGLVGVIQVNNAGSGTLCRAYMYDCLANMNVESVRSDEGDCRTGGAVGNVTINQNQVIAIDNCGVLGNSIVATYNKVGGFVGWTNAGNADRLMVRNCYTLVSSVPGSANYGGFVGIAQNYGQYLYCYYVADDSNSSISTNITKEALTKTTASTICSAATCSTFNSKTTYSLEVNGKTYSSALGWAIPDGVDYPVPGALIALGEEYYK